MKKAREAKKPKVLFVSNEYTISKIPLNFKIDINPALVRKNHVAGIDRDCYSDPSLGLENAHRVANYVIDTYFKRPINPRVSVLEREFSGNAVY